MKEFTIQVPDEQAVENAALEQGKSVDEVFAEAAKREMAQLMSIMYRIRYIGSRMICQK